MRLFLFFILVLGVVKNSYGSSSAERPLVVVSVHPLSLLVQQLGGNEFQVEELLPQGTDVHLFELKPSERVLLEKAQLIILNGGLESWEKAVKDQGNLLSLTQSVSADRTNALWVVPQFINRMLPALEERLCQLKATACSTIQKNRLQLEHDLKELQQRFSNVVDKSRHSSFVSVHAVWGALAKEYGLTELGGIADCTTEGESIKIIKKVRGVALDQKLQYYLTESPPSREPATRELALQELGLSPVFLDSMGKDSSSLQQYFETIIESFQKVLNG